MCITECVHWPGLALELAELLGGPGGQGLSFGGLGAPALSQQVVYERTHLHQLGHILPERGAEVPEMEGQDVGEKAAVLPKQ